MKFNKNDLYNELIVDRINYQFNLYNKLTVDRVNYQFNLYNELTVDRVNYQFNSRINHKRTCDCQCQHTRQRGKEIWGARENVRTRFK